MSKRYLAIPALLLLAAPAAAEPLHGYGSFNGLYGLHSWGSADVAAFEGDPKLGDLSDPNFDTGATGGFMFSGYSVVFGETVHVGGYLAYQAGEMHLLSQRVQTAANPRGIVLDETHTLHDLALGISAKLAYRVARRGWFGMVVDMGPSFLFSGGDRLATGLRLFPRIVVDYLPWMLRGRYQVGFTFSAGLVVDVYGDGTLNYRDPATGGAASSDFDYSSLKPMLMFGGIFGV